MQPHRLLLLVEDDLHLREFYAMTLRSAGGYDVRVANDGFEALHLIESTKPELIVLDLGLPRVSGGDVLAELDANAATRDIPVVVVTGSEEPADYQNVACRLRKPVDSTQLLTAVRRCLDGPHVDGRRRRVNN